MASIVILTLVIAVGTVFVSAEVQGAQKGLRLHKNAKETEHDGREVGNVDTHQKHHTSLIVQEPHVDQHLMVCNAYTSHVPLEIVQVRTRESLNAAKPLAYKQCAHFTVPLHEGDQLDFKAGRLEVGTFYATGLPAYSGSLLLIAHRRRPTAQGLGFESHAFAQTENPQLVVIDTYRGKETGSLKIVESGPVEQGKEKNADDLNFNSVIAVNPGNYDVVLSGNSTVSKLPLKADEKGKYVVMRVGNELLSTKVGHYPMELIVFPNSSTGMHVNVCVLLGIFAVLRGILLSG
jgi:hypothetical protein